MAVAITEEKLNAARTYLKDTADRFAGLLEATSRSEMPATAHWTVADTAVHVVALARLCAWKPSFGPPVDQGPSHQRETASGTNVRGLPRVVSVRPAFPDDRTKLRLDPS